MKHQRVSMRNRKSLEGRQTSHCLDSSFLGSLALSDSLVADSATPDKGRGELKPVVSEKAEPEGRSLQSKEALEVTELPAAESTAPAVTKGRVSKKPQPDSQPAPRVATESKPKPKDKPKSKQSAKSKRQGEKSAGMSKTSKRSPLGTLQLRVEEGWYNVMLGNRRLGTTPLGGVSLPVGQHLLVLDNPVTENAER